MSSSINLGDNIENRKVSIRIESERIHLERCKVEVFEELKHGSNEDPDFGCQFFVCEVFQKSLKIRIAGRVSDRNFNLSHVSFPVLLDFNAS